MRRGVVALLFACSGCDKLLGLDVHSLADGNDDGHAACAHGGAFAAGSPVAIAGSYSVEAARFTPAQNVAYLSLCDASGDKSTCDLYTAFLTSTSAFGGYSDLTAVSTAGVYDSYPSITADGQYLIFGSERANNGTVGVYVATAQNGGFQNPIITPLSIVPGANDSNEPYILGDGQTIYFSASPDGNPDTWDLYRATGGLPGFGGTAAKLAGVDTADNELAAVVSDDELEIFFASDHQQRGGDGMSLDIYTATRARAADAFGTPARVAALSGDTIDWPVWISPDNCTLYYIQKVHATNGVATVYVTHR